MLPKDPLSKPQIQERWETILNALKNVDTEWKGSVGNWHLGFPSGHVVNNFVLKSAYSLVFVQGYSLLQEVKGSNLHDNTYQNQKHITDCNILRNNIAHHYTLLDSVECHRMIGYIQTELEYWKLL